MRNTDRDWQTIAETAPYYGVLVHERFRNPTAEAMAEFFAMGENDIKVHLTAIRSHLGAFSPKSAFDFGCGPGRQLIPLARETGDAYGVDISDRMLELARHHIAEAGVNAVVSTDFPDRTFDWVNSTIVMQHIAPRRGYEILRRLWRILNSEGVISVHLTIYHDRGATGELIRDLARYSYDGEQVISYDDTGDAAIGSMSMYDYDLSRVFSAFDFPDGQAIYLVKTIHGASHGVILYARKMASVR
jgi:trans-aconitate methyltransferase